MQQACKICNSTSEVMEYAGKEAYNLNCPRCGLFQITSDALTKFERSDLHNKILLVSYWIRQHQSNENLPIFIDLKLMRTILETHFVFQKPNEQADNLLLWIGDSVGKPDGYTSMPVKYLISIVGAVDEENVIYVVHYLQEQGYIKHQGFTYSVHDGVRNPAVNTLKAQMTFKGWAKYDELTNISKDSRLAFMAMQYDNEVLDRIFNAVIIPAVKETDFEIRKLDQEKRAGSIDDKLRVEIRRSKFLIADLSDENRGAYWESGYAEGLGMQVIYICEKEKFEKLSTHFDTNHHLTVKWKDDPDSLKKFAEELKATIRATFPAEAKMED